MKKDNKMDIFYIYDADATKDLEIKTKITTSTRIKSNLSLKDKLTILLNELESVMGDISIKITSIENDNATINAREKMPLWGATGPKLRAKSIEASIKQQSFDGNWFKDIRLEYNNGISNIIF